MIGIPALQAVARAKWRQQAAFFIVFFAFILGGLFGIVHTRMFLLLIVGTMAGGAIVGLVVRYRMFIRWRLRAYETASSIRQIHLIARLYSMVVDRRLESLLTLLSSKAEVRHWKSLLVRVKLSSLSFFPETTPDSKVIRYSTKSRWLVLSVSALGLLCFTVAQSPYISTIYWIILVCMAVFSAHSIYVIRKKKPVLVLSSQGIHFPEDEYSVIWGDISKEQLEKLYAGRYQLYNLKYWHREHEEIHPANNWDIAPGELRYLLLWYRHAYETGSKQTGTSK